MVNKVVKDIKDAAYKFSVGRTSDARHLTRETSLKITQYFYNNTCFDLTTQDNFGVKSLHKKVATRTGDKFIRIIREYTTPYVNVHGFRDFVDSINKEDGPILNAIKAQFDGDQMYLTGGFAELCSDNIYDGHSFSIALMYPEEILNNHKSIFCAISGLVISKHNLDNIPVNPVHGKDVGFVHDVVPDFELIIKSYQVLCNKAEIGKEKFYFTLGATVQESCRVQLEDKEAGIYIYEQSKNITTGHTESILIKFLKFSEVSAEHGIFKNKLEASVSLNLEKTQREKLHMLEQEKFENDKLKLGIEKENLELKLLVQQQEKELTSIKNEFEIFKLNLEKDLTTTKYIQEKSMLEMNFVFEKLKHDLKLKEYEKKINSLQLESAFENQAHTIRMTELEYKEHISQAVFFNNQIEIVAKRENIIAQKELDNLNFYIKKKMLETANNLDIQQHERKSLDESNKTFNSGISIISSIMKLLK
jgi:hypothetical protein